MELVNGMQELFLNALIACIALAIIIATGKILFTLLRGLFGALGFVSTFMSSGTGPNPSAVALFRGRIVEARNWHGSTDGRLYSEFWLRAEDGLERRYKLKDIHPNLRKGHQVALYEYAGTLVAINNRSTGAESWVAPGWLLSSLYPTGRFRRFVFWSLSIWVAYYFLKPSDPTFEQVFLFIAWMIFAGLTLVLVLKHLLSTHSRRSNQLSEFAAFCYQTASE